MAVAFKTLRVTAMGSGDHLLPHRPRTCSPAEPWPGPGGGGNADSAVSGYGFCHLAVFYRSRSEYLSVLRHFVLAGRQRAEAVLVAVPQPSADLVRRELCGSSAGITLLDLTELGRNPARMIPAFLSFARKHRGERMCCISEPAWPGRTAQEMQETARHEALVNVAFRDTPASVLCLYDIAGIPRAALADAESTHPAFVRDRQHTVSTSYLGPRDFLPAGQQALPPPPAYAETLDYSDDLRWVRHLVASKAESAGLSQRQIFDLVIAVSELAANTLRHTSAGGTVHVWQTGAEIVCQVTDTGQITDPLAGRRAVCDDLVGGIGLWVVNQVCDLTQTRTGPQGTTTRVQMLLHRP